MRSNLGISAEGIRLAEQVKEGYRKGEPIVVPDQRDRILMPEHLLNHDLDLTGFEDPLPLALVAVRDPEAPMALSAAARLSPKVGNRKLVRAVFDVVGEKSRHDLVTKCVEMVTDADFCPDAIARLRRYSSAYVEQMRRHYTEGLRTLLRSLVDGDITPRGFVRSFFDLTEGGNLRHDIRKRLVCSLLASPTVRPAIKFLFLENFYRFPVSVREAIVAQMMTAPDGPHTVQIKDELRWIMSSGGDGRRTSDPAVH